MNLRKSFYAFLIVLSTIQPFYLTALYSQSQDSLEKNKVIPVDTISRNVTKFEEAIIEDKPKTELSLDKQMQEFFDIEKILWILAILIVGYFLLKFITRSIQFISNKTLRYRNILDGFVPVIILLGWGIILYVILVIIIKLPDGILISIAAAISIALGIAARDILKNVFGGIMIMFEKPFRRGDKIKLGEHYGQVFKIGLRATSIKTEDDSLVTIPNSEIMNKPVSNSNYGESNCQVVAEIYLPVDIDTTRAREIAIETAKVSRHIYLNKPITVLFINEVKGRKSYLKMRLKAYVMDLNYEYSLTSEMTEIVIRELLKEGLISKDATV